MWQHARASRSPALPWTPSGPTGDGRCFFILKKYGDGDNIIIDQVVSIGVLFGLIPKGRYYV